MANITLEFSDIILQGDVDRQPTLNALTDVANATNEYVLTKDTATGNAIFKASQGSGGTVSYVVSFSSVNLSSGVLVINHNLNQKYVQVSVYDNNDKQIRPSTILMIDANNCSIDISPFGSITGNWNVVVSK
jgi:hypothetical protein